MYINNTRDIEPDLSEINLTMKENYVHFLHHSLDFFILIAEDKVATGNRSLNLSLSGIEEEE